MAAGKLLIVDDEATLVDLLRRYLERLGYTVEVASDSTTALRLFAQQADGFDLVITDLSLPGLNGEELLSKIRELNPKQKGLISSGYPYEPALEGIGFIQKPFLPKMLVSAIESFLK